MLEIARERGLERIPPKRDHLKPIGNRLLAGQIERMMTDMLDQAGRNDSLSEGREK